MRFIKFVFPFITCLLPAVVLAQEKVMVLVAPVLMEQVETGKCVKQIIERNGVSIDSVMQFLNRKLVDELLQTIPPVQFMMIDTVSAHTIYNGSVINEMFTSSHLSKANHATGFKKIRVYNERSPSVRYLGLEFSPVAIDLAKQEMVRKDADFFILFSKLDLSYPGKYGFVLHYEIYDQGFNRIAGEKYTHIFPVSKKMYYNAFVFYLNYCLEGFSNFLLKHNNFLKK